MSLRNRKTRMRSISEVVDEIKSRVHECSQQGLASLSGRSEITIGHITANAVHHERVAFIVAADWTMKLIFRVAFTTDQILKIANKNSDSSSTDKSRAIDFVKEFCNLTGGYLIQMLESDDRPMGLSIPIDNRATKQSLAAKTSSAGVHHDSWFLSYLGASVRCMLTIEITAADAVQHIVLNQVKSAQADDELEFL